MAGYVYLIRNKDICMIGIAKNLEKKFKSLRPDEIIKSIKVNNPRNLQVRLFRKYKSCRIPDTECFRFSFNEIESCKNYMNYKNNRLLGINDEVNIALSASIFIFIFINFFLMKINIPFLQSIGISIFLCSLPLWTVFILGNFGGYDCDDLPFFSTWLNRLKALFFALLLSYSSSLLLNVF